MNRSDGMDEQDRDQFWKILSDEARTGLYRWRDGQPYKIHPIEWLGGGKSGSPIAIIARPGRGFNDQVLIKFARTGEINNWQQAWNDCGDEFRQAHLVAMLTNSPITGGKDPWWIGILKIAAGDTSAFRPMAELTEKKGDDFAKICKTIISSVIADWNPMSQLAPPGEVARLKYFSEIFDVNRVVKDKPLGRWFYSRFKNLDDPLIRQKGWPEWQPNPFIFAGKADQIADRGQVGIQYGRAHGDLHLYNVLMPVDPPRATRYKLIDLGGYCSRAPLARDPMCFLLAIAFEWLCSGMNPGSALSRPLIDVVVRPNKNSTDKEYRIVSQAIHEAGRKWASSNGWGGEWREQSLLLLAGCALRYASKDLSEIDDQDAARGWLFDVAVAAARAYLEETRLWESYREFYTPDSLGSLYSGKSQEVSDPSIFPQSENINGQDSEENPDAQVFEFPNGAELDLVKNLTKSQGTVAAEATWGNLVDILREVDFGGSSWEELARKTAPLMEEISYKRPPHPLHEAEIQNHLTRLQRILNDALKPGVSAAKVRSASTYADNLRGYLLDLLSGPKA
jgi:hypothetical protein